MKTPSSMPLGAAREREHGQVLVLFAFILVSLLLVSALAIDYGGWLLARRTYQNVADQAALAGAYQLTSPIDAQCTVAQPSKNHCAREAAWNSVQQALGLTGLTPAVQADSIGDTPYAENGYRIWVASPPSDAGAAYAGFASSLKTIFVRVERDLQGGFSRIIKPLTTVGSWATAGRIPENFAILILCGPPTCTPPSGQDLQVAGTGSNLILESGDLGSNSFGKTSGNNASIALSDTSSAYMHYPSQCAIGSPSCLIDRWTGSAVDTSTQYGALALPQVIDPLYQRPPTTSGTSGGVVSGTAPYQCYSTTSSSIPAVSAASEPFAQGPTINGSPVNLLSAVGPAPSGGVQLASTAAGTVTAAVGGAKINGIKVTLTPGGYNATTSGGGPGAGQYSIGGVPGGTYTLTATDATNVYHTYTTTITVPASGTVTTSFSMNKNPVVTGTVRDSVTSAVIAGATVTITGLTGSPFTATSNASGVYSVIVTNAGTFDATASATNYAALSYVGNAAVLDQTTTLNFSLNPNAGTIQGTVSSGSGPLVGATVTVAGVGSVTTTAGGAYTIGVPAGTYSVTASMTGYNSSTATVTVGAGATVTRNFVLVAAATITGTITDDTTGLPLAGATVTVSSGPSTGNAPVTTNAAGVYTITGLSAGNGYRIQASLSGYETGTSNNTNVSGTTTINLALWPSHCGTGGNTGKWNCSYGTVGSCPTVNPIGSTGATINCSTFDSTNRIRPGTYEDITIGANECAWIDPLGGTPGVTSGQTPGLVYVTDTLSIGSDAFIFGDGVTIVLGPDAHVSVNNGGGFILNYYDPDNTYGGGSHWRTASYIGGVGVTPCAGDPDGSADLRRGAFTTKDRYTWDTSVSPACYNDTPVVLGEIGMTWYLRDTATCCGGHRFYFNGAMGFLFDGVLYGPKDDIKLGGQGAQAAAGQIVAWTLTYAGDTDIHQRYSGIEVDGPPYLIEPYLGE
jgi:hypothetical protein